jgi:hypothetical protein
MANRNYPKNVTATTVIPFDNPVTYIPPKTVTGAITFTKTTTGAQAGYCSIIRVVADGSHTPDLSAFKLIGTGTWDNTSGAVNQLWFVFDGVIIVCPLLTRQLFQEVEAEGTLHRQQW